MTNGDVRRHAVADERIEKAATNIYGRAGAWWEFLREDYQPLRQGLMEFREELADHIAARTVVDPALSTPDSRLAVLTAAHLGLGVLNLACFPDGDISVHVPLVSDDVFGRSELKYDYEEALEPAGQTTTARTWLEGFAWCAVSGLLKDRTRRAGPLLLLDYAPAIRNGVPFSERESVSEPADLAEMDALCGYLDVVEGPYLSHSSAPAPLAKPDAAERARLAAKLDAAGPLSADQYLLRVLLDDDQPAFEHALRDRLVSHRETIKPDPAPHTLLPLGAITLATLAHEAHGWHVHTRSAYLPATLLSPPAP